jgi:hypothetical protein
MSFTMRTRRTSPDSLDRWIADLKRIDWPDTTNPFCGRGVLAEPCRIRAGHLRLYLEEMLRRRPHTMLVAEAFGYRGGRVTGIPLTSERIVCENERFRHEFPELAVSYRRCPEPGAPQGEATASIVWDLLKESSIGTAPACWNVVPVHPYDPRIGTWSNRPPRPAEIREGAEFARRLIRLLEPGQVIAIGRAAERGLADAGIPCVAVRHPSNGGATQFRRQCEGLL